MIEKQLMKYGLILLFLISLFSFGFYKGKESQINKYNKEQVKILNDAIETASKNINNFNNLNLINFENALKNAEQRSKEKQKDYLTSEELREYFKLNQELFKECNIDKNQLDKINLIIEKSK